MAALATARAVAHETLPDLMLTSPHDDGALGVVVVVAGVVVVEDEGAVEGVAGPVVPVGVPVTDSKSMTKIRVESA